MKDITFEKFLKIINTKNVTAEDGSAIDFKKFNKTSFREILMFGKNEIFCRMSDTPVTITFKINN